MLNGKHFVETFYKLLKKSSENDVVHLDYEKKIFSCMIVLQMGKTPSNISLFLGQQMIFRNVKAMS